MSRTAGNKLIKVISDQVKTVLEPSAQIKEVCNSRPGETIEYNDILYKVEVLKNLDFRVYIIARLQLQHGLRISEALAIRHSDINKHGFCRVQVLKSKSERVINISEFMKHLHHVVGLNVSIFDNISRFYVYRLYRRLGIVLEVQGNNNLTVTHSLRHIAVTSSLEVAGVEAVRQDILHHKSKEAFEYYNKKVK